MFSHTHTYVPACACVQSHTETDGQKDGKKADNSATMLDVQSHTETDGQKDGKKADNSATMLDVQSHTETVGQKDGKKADNSATMLDSPVSHLHRKKKNLKAGIRVNGDLIFLS